MTIEELQNQYIKISKYNYKFWKPKKLYKNIVINSQLINNKIYVVHNNFFQDNINDLTQKINFLQYILIKYKFK